MPGTRPWGGVGKAIAALVLRQAAAQFTTRMRLTYHGAFDILTRS
ncbi:hypothetical protein [Frankia sp. Cppng1_Ct_nod]|nr:hypothetical protein [Frankia sp. Cppng1_Ct_nod]